MSEVLAPAGSWESLEAAVRCGADAVYLGGKRFSARAGAENFDTAQLAKAASYCRVRGVKLYQAVNTVVFDQELPQLERTVGEAWEAGVDGLIIQDLAVASLARRVAPGMPLHGSTQMGAHNLEGVKLLEDMGFCRVVLARELSLEEIDTIARGTRMELECFVHGALCMCVSGQCYLSSMIGGRSGNRGQCAQPCRLPFASQSNSHALSLRDLSLVGRMGQLVQAGVHSFKIEGRLKRPEYVAAAVTACRQALAGEKPDFAALEAVFSRSGFTTGYYDGDRQDMFGLRRKENVTAAAPVLKELAGLYRRERQAVPLSGTVTLGWGQPVELTLADAEGRRVKVCDQPPQQARTAPTTEEKVRIAVCKTGGTPYRIDSLHCTLDEGLMVPASVLNALRRQALEELTALREAAGRVRPAVPAPEKTKPHKGPAAPALWVRLGSGRQWSSLMNRAERLVASAEVLEELLENGRFDPGKLVVELPRVSFSHGKRLEERLKALGERGVAQAMAGDLGGVRLAGRLGFEVHGGFGLNCTNRLALAQWRKQGLASVTLSLEIELAKAREMEGEIPRGILAYGYLPLMLTRNVPDGAGRTAPWLEDRLGNRFALDIGPESTQLLNCVPLYLADRLRELAGLDFLLLYFSTENREECEDILARYQEGRPLPEGKPKTRGLYYRQVL